MRETLAAIMMNKTLNILFSFLSLSVIGQNFSKKDFSNTDWFTNNKNNHFYTADTVKLVKYTNKSSEYWRKSFEYSENEHDYLNQGNYITLGFRSSTNVEYSEHFDSGVTALDINPNYWWDFDKKKNILSVHKNDNLLFRLKPIYKKQIGIKSRFKDEKIETVEITLLRIK